VNALIVDVALHLICAIPSVQCNTYMKMMMKMIMMMIRKRRRRIIDFLQK
jgi:hypothetical protein